MKTVWVLGSLNLDVTYSVDKLPGEGMTVSALSSAQAPGGKGLNQAAAAAWTGAPVSLIGAVGSDANGAALAGVAASRGIDAKHLVRLECPTGSAVILVNSAGANIIVVNSGANGRVPLGGLEGLSGGDYLVSQLETNLDAVEHYFALAKARGGVTVLNPSPYAELPPSVIDNTDILVANEHEARIMTGAVISTAADVKKNEAALCARIKNVVVTLGGNGAAMLFGGAFYSVAGGEDKVVDTQGAGDAFLGVFIGSLARGMDAPDALALANAVASRCVSARGSTLASLPDKEAFMEEIK